MGKSEIDGESQLFSRIGILNTSHGCHCHRLMMVSLIRTASEEQSIMGPDMVSRFAIVLGWFWQLKYARLSTQSTGETIFADAGLLLWTLQSRTSSGRIEYFSTIAIHHESPS